MRRATSLCALLSAALLSLPAPLSAAESSFRPLEFDGDYAFEFETPTIQMMGTIELALTAAAVLEPDNERICLLRCDSPDDIRFSIYMRHDRKAVGFTNGVTSTELPVPLDDGLRHHLAFVTAGTATCLFLDGNFAGYFPYGYGEADDNPLTVGMWGDGTGAFVGELHVLRVWDHVFFEDVLRDLKGRDDIPQDYPREDHLLAASSFHTDEASMLQMKPILYLSDVAGRESELIHQEILPLNRPLHAIRINYHTTMVADQLRTGIDSLVPLTRGDDGALQTVQDVRMERDEEFRSARSRVSAHAVLVDLDSFEALLAEQAGILQFFQDRESLELLRAHVTEYLAVTDELNQIVEPDRGLASPAPEAVPPPVLREQRAAVLEAIEMLRDEYTSQFSAPENERPDQARRLLASVDRLEEALRALPMPPMLSRRPSASVPPESELFEVTPAAAGGSIRLLGFTGLYNGQLTAVRFITNRGLSKPFGDVSDESATPFVVLFPPKSRCTGFVTFGDLMLEGAAAAWVQDAGPDQPVVPLSRSLDVAVAEENLGRFIREGVKMPVRNDIGVIQQAELNRTLGNLIDPESGEVMPHGNYTSFPVASLRKRSDGRLRLCVDSPNHLNEHDGLVSEFIFRPMPTGAADSLYVTADKSSILEYQGGDEFVWKRKVHDGRWTARRFRRPKPYDSSADAHQKLPWGDTFSSEQRPAMSEFNFRGYHIARMDPRNYQLGTGTSTRLFRWPSDDSVDYQTSTVGRIVPHGVFLRNDREAAETSKSFDASNSQEHQSAWNVNLGFSIGIPGLASFGANGGYRQEHQEMYGRQKGYSVSMITETKYALVLDRSRMNLDPDFRAAVQLLADRILAGQDLSNGRLYRKFIREWGSHYPHAVTYGGMAYQELSYTAEEMSEMTAAGYDIKTQASATIEGVSLGQEMGGGHSWSDKYAHSRRDQEGMVRTIGGDISLGGGWNLPDHHEVPVMLDLRPITELFSPLFFDDPVIWRQLQPVLREQLEVVMAEYHIPLMGQSSHFVELQIDEIVNNTRNSVGFNVDNNGAGFVQYYAFNIFADESVSNRPIDHIDRVSQSMDLLNANHDPNAVFEIRSNGRARFPNPQLKDFGRAIFQLKGSPFHRMPDGSTAKLEGAEWAAQVSFYAAPMADQLFERSGSSENIQFDSSGISRGWIHFDLTDFEPRTRSEFKLPLRGYVDYHRRGRPANETVRVWFSLARYPRRGQP